MRIAILILMCQFAYGQNYSPPPIDPCGIDERCRALSTNQSAFLSGSGWIEITSSEYVALGNQLGGQIYGAADTQIANPTGSQDGSTVSIHSSDASDNIPINQYVVAAKLRTNDFQTVRLKIGNPPSLTNIGGALPASAAGIKYFIYKGDFQSLEANSKPAIYNSGSTRTSNDAFDIKSISGDSPNPFFIINNTTVCLQYLTTSTKQW